VVSSSCVDRPLLGELDHTVGPSLSVLLKVKSTEIVVLSVPKTTFTCRAEECLAKAGFSEVDK
jgi:hypothetical protein